MHVKPNGHSEGSKRGHATKKKRRFMEELQVKSSVIVDRLELQVSEIRGRAMHELNELHAGLLKKYRL